MCRTRRARSPLAGLARPHLIVSVPREPLWRALNLARGRYWRALGNTPGHLQHWSTPGFLALLQQHLEVVELRTPAALDDRALPRPLTCAAMSAPAPSARPLARLAGGRRVARVRRRPTVAGRRLALAGRQLAPLLLTDRSPAP